MIQPSILPELVRLAYQLGYVKQDAEPTVEYLNQGAFHYNELLQAHTQGMTQKLYVLTLTPGNCQLLLEHIINMPPQTFSRDAARAMVHRAKHELGWSYRKLDELRRKVM